MGLFKTKHIEMDFNYLCNMEYKRVLLLMKEVEEEFGISLKDHKDLRHKFLDVANFIKELPNIKEDD